VASVDVDLSSGDTPAPRASSTTGLAFQPSLSQVAAARVRWPGRSRSGYHGSSSWNWMRDGSAGFGDYRIGDR
jgi:hypothetical protein